MAEDKEQKSKGKATEVKLRENFQPNKDEIRKMQEKAREVSPFLLDLLEAEEYQGDESL